MVSPQSIHLYIEPAASGLKYCFEIYNENSKATRWDGKSVLVGLDGDKQETGDIVVYFHEKPFDVALRATYDTGSVRYEPGQKRTPQTSTHVAYLNDAAIPLVIRAYVFAPINRRRMSGWCRAGDACYSKAQLATSFEGFCVSTADFFFCTAEEYRPPAKIWCHGGTSTCDPATFPGIGHEEAAELTQRVMGTVREFEQESLQTLDDTPGSFVPIKFYVPGLPLIDGQPQCMGVDSFFQPAQAATERYYLDRLRETLLVRGIADFMALEDEEELLHIVDHVVRTHVCTRPYVADKVHNPTGTGGYHFVRSDYERYADCVPGDCEDSAVVIYRLLEGLLYGRFKNKMVLKLQRAAWNLGVPCCVAGTFAKADHPFAHTSGGHMYAVAIPVPVFLKMVGKEDLCAELQATYGFNMKRTQIAFLEGVYRTSMFYRDRSTSPAKKAFHEQVVKWLRKKEDARGPWQWDKFSITWPLDMSHRGQFYAFRLFTGFLDMVGVNRPPYSFYIINNLIDAPFKTKEVDKLKSQRGKVGTYAFVLGSEDLNKDGTPIVLLKEAPSSRAYRELDFDTRRKYDRPIFPLDDPVDFFPCLGAPSRRVVEDSPPHNLKIDERYVIYCYNGAECSDKDIGDCPRGRTGRCYYYKCGHGTAMVVQL